MALEGRQRYVIKYGAGIVKLSQGPRLTPEIQDQTFSFPLRHQIQVFSGITPPPGLIARMNTDPSSNTTRPPRPVSFPPANNPNAIPPRPARPSGAAAAPATPQTTDPNLPGFEEPPPSYEDAVAADMAPVDGPRPDYRPPERTLTDPDGMLARQRREGKSASGSNEGGMTIRDV